jgi:hypothetical protein
MFHFDFKASTEGKLCREAGTAEVTSIPSLPCFVGGSQHCKKEQLAHCKTYSTRLLGEFLNCIAIYSFFHRKMPKLVNLAFIKK